MLSCDIDTCMDHVISPTVTCYLIISHDNDFKNKCENWASVTPNIDDTDTEDSTNNDKGSAYLANAWMEEWKSYINSVEDVPEGMSLVCWWGVRILFHSCVINARWHMCTIDAWVPLPNMVFSRLWLPCCNGIFGCKQTCLFLCWDHHLQASQSAWRRYCWGFTMSQIIHPTRLDGEGVSERCWWRDTTRWRW